MVETLAKRRFRRVRRYYARARRSASKMTIPLAPISGLAAGMVQPLQYAQTGAWDAALLQMVKNYTGIHLEDGQFYLDDLKKGMIPLLIGMAVHKGANMLGVNRALAAAKVPILRV